MSFKFNLKSKVKIITSGEGESGEVIGRAEYSTSSNSYLIRYKAGNGRAVESWWNEDALEVV